MPRPPPQGASFGFGSSSHASSASRSLLFRCQTLVDGLDEVVGGPWAGAGSVFPVVRLGRVGGLDLIQSHTGADHAFDIVADDHHHVTVLDHVELRADTPVAR